jgi:lipid A ethanolaminephosphotransferase
MTHGQLRNIDSPSKKPCFQIHCNSPVTLALAISATLLVFYNLRFWGNTIAALWSGSVSDTLFIGSLFLALLFLHAGFLLLIPGKTLFRIVVTILFLVAAVASYSSDTYGIFIDKDMIRNLFETDRREASALLNLRFVSYLVLLGFVPPALIARVSLPALGIRRQLLERFGFLAAGLVLSAGMVLALSAHYSVFLREHKSLRYLLSPGAALQGAIRYLQNADQNVNGHRFVDNSGITTRAVKDPHDKPVLMFLVVGETARAHNFQLGGYSRATNPQLAKLQDLYYFNNVRSCGTSTAISLPCMFSPLTRANFRVSGAAETSNLLDALIKGGITVEWRDNNSGSKGVSARAKTIEYGADADPVLCNEESCYDEIMLKGLDRTLASIRDDAVIVFHQIGSHGPAYAKRYPPEFELFKPVCRTNELNKCSEESIHNAYDNSIAYTDHNLARQVAILKSVSDRFDASLIYVSDHGESLGEKGLFLHGAPYVFAPDEQTKVPFVLWMSEGYRQRFSIDESCLRSQLAKPFSHDNLYHTVLGAMTVNNVIYQSSADMVAACRHAGTSSDIQH